MTTRDELIVALSGRYALGSRADRGRMLDEFAALTGRHRKLAMRLSRAGASSGPSNPRPERRVYDQATREALIVVSASSVRIYRNRLSPLVPILVSALERHGHLQLAPEVLAGLLAMSAATMDRALLGRLGIREDGYAAARLPRRRSGVALRCAPLTSGMIRRPGLWRRIWWRIVGRWRRAATCRR